MVTFVDGILILSHQFNRGGICGGNTSCCVVLKFVFAMIDTRSRDAKYQFRFELTPEEIKVSNHSFCPAFAYLCTVTDRRI